MGGAWPRLTKPTSASTNARSAQRALEPWRRFVRIAAVNLFDGRGGEKRSRFPCSGVLRAPECCGRFTRSRRSGTCLASHSLTVYQSFRRTALGRKYCRRRIDTISRVIPSRADGKEPRNCKLPLHPCRKAHIAFESSFGALRQPQDDNVGSAISSRRFRNRSSLRLFERRGSLEVTSAGA